jgi:hypothetical protein
MLRIKLSCLCLTVVLATCMAAVAEASAEPEHIYKIEQVKLEAGKVKEITAKLKPGTEFTIETTGPFGIKSVIKCKKIKLNPAEKPAIVGGVPGRSEKEKFEFEECAATVGGAKCEKATIETALINNELVSIVAPVIKKELLAMLFTPAVGKVFMKIKLVKCGIFGNQLAEVEGTTAAQIVPEKIDVIALVLVWSKVEEITLVKSQNGVMSAVGLKATGNVASFGGEVELELLSKEKWGVF